MPRPAPRPSPLTDGLRAAAAAKGLTPGALARLSAVDAAVVGRFLAGTRDVRLATADRLADALGLKLADAPRGRGRPRKGPISSGPEARDRTPEEAPGPAETGESAPEDRTPPATED